MKTKTKLRILVSMTVLTGLSLSFKSIDPKKENKLQNTMVIAHLDERIEPDQNTVFTSTFLMAWKLLKDDIIGGDIRLQKPVSLTPQFNKASSGIIVNDDFLAKGGLVEDGIVEEINKDLKRKFNIGKPGLAEYEDLNDNIICFSYFNEGIGFKYPFEEHKNLYPFFVNRDRTDVVCFGIGDKDNTRSGKRIRDQVEIYDNQGCNNFILKLNGISDENELYLAKVPLMKTLGETIRTVEERISNSNPASLNDGDVLVVPKLKVSVNKSYDELLGKHLANDGFERYFFAVADQEINFSLDESGAKTTSEAVIVLKKGPCDGRYLFDRPFLLYMKKKGSNQPYFAMWVANPEIMIGRNNK